MDANVKVHNKSGTSRLKILELSQESLKDVQQALKQSDKKSVKRLASTQCKLTQAADGRVSIGGKKVAFGYQVVALDKFGQGLQTVSSVKNEEGAKTISHVCGTAFCLNPDHLVLEAKKVNDERTHCHFVMQVAKDNGCLEELLKLQFCSHDPVCGST